MVLCFGYQQGQSSPAGTEDRQMAYSIAQAATLIADFDVPLSRLYTAQPFRRRAIAETFEAQIAPVIGAELAARVAAVLLIAAEAAR
jgi:hypothetical protein